MMGKELSVWKPSYRFIKSGANNMRLPMKACTIKLKNYCVIDLAKNRSVLLRMKIPFNKTCLKQGSCGRTDKKWDFKFNARTLERYFNEIGPCIKLFSRSVVSNVFQTHEP